MFIGHYWLTKEPELLAPNIACTDYSVADELTEEERSLCAYRWDGEQRLDSANFKRVEAIPPPIIHLRAFPLRHMRR